MTKYKNFFGIPVYHMDNAERAERKMRHFVACADSTNRLIIVFDEFFRLREERKFILMHELGHIMSYPDTSETAANEWAISHIAGDRDDIIRIMDSLYKKTDEMRPSVRRMLGLD